MRGLGLLATLIAAFTFILSIILKAADAEIFWGLNELSFWRFTIAALLFAAVFILHGTESAK
jgi:hypothetical protein